VTGEKQAAFRGGRYVQLEWDQGGMTGCTWLDCGLDVKGTGYGAGDQVEELLLGLGGLEVDVLDLFVEVLLGVYVEVVVLFTLAEEFLFELVLALGQVLGVIEMLASEVVVQVDISLEKVL